MERIKAALKPCQLCEAGRLHGQVSVDAAATADSVLARRAINDHTPSSGVTTLSPDDEDTLRKAMSSLFGLEPVELLLVQHVMHGGSYASFSDVLLDILRYLRVREAELDGRRHGFRALAKTWADRIEDKMPQLSPVLKSRIYG